MVGLLEGTVATRNCRSPYGSQYREAVLPPKPWAQDEDDSVCRQYGTIIGTVACIVLSIVTLLVVNWARHRSAGEVVQARAAPEFDCGRAEAIEYWTEEQKRWCCSGSGIACPTTTKLPFDCSDSVNWQNNWSPGKQAWCCDHFGSGCPKTSTAVPFNCEVGVKTWTKDWSVNKKAWCCEHEYVGCPDAARVPDARVPTTSRPQAPAPWRAYDVSARVPAVPPSSVVVDTHGPPFDCTKGVATFLVSWRKQQQMWCCEHMGVACTEFLPS